MLVFQSEPIFMFHQDTYQNGKALKRGAHISFEGESTNFHKFALIFSKKSDACKKYKIKIDASNESYELFIQVLSG